MIVIAENLNVRNKAYMEAVKNQDKKTIESLSKTLADKGADIINVQCSLDGIGDEETLPLVADIVQEAAKLPLCLDSRNTEALKKTLTVCKEPPLINYLSQDEENTDEILSLVSRFKASLIIRALKGTVPTTLEAKLLILEDLIEKANAADIPNERLFADPSVVHIGGGIGQEHLLNTHECIIALNEMVDPPINTIAWISNISTGMPKGVKSRINSAFLCYLSGAGLDAAMVDVNDAEIMKTVYLIRSFRDEIVFSSADIL
ncbi:methyltetrahydrofolate--corrinoid methyltransferase [Dissulfurispira thermophila]|uniref:Methyltetrahydrofolate--corrinoid methyltransferase n=2 Tax=root TaxID=1 RepID=A0A7G1H5B0_9BACT|nr:dihydropteroate synthase [Dissulfurispira thermophila]BCB97106.1 methyltetrahydrofolate--corrinoid methyltransferase [Dissulfurispira thermophila]